MVYWYQYFINLSEIYIKLTFIYLPIFIIVLVFPLYTLRTISKALLFLIQSSNIIINSRGEENAFTFSVFLSTFLMA